MRIAQLSCTYFRNLVPQTIDFHPHLNHIYGANGSGKTALLEALYILGRGKSFRDTNIRHTIAHNSTFFRLVSQLHDDDGNQHCLGIERQIQQTTLRLDGAFIHSLSALATILPIHILNSDYFSLITGGPDFRRRFIDYGLFYQTPEFLPAWQKYQYALKNRNAALRQQWADHLLIPWHNLMAQQATIIDSLRRSYLAELQKNLNHYHKQLGGTEEITLCYSPGWAQETPLEQCLNAHITRDRHLKQTRDGIHRAEWRMLTNGRDIAYIFSRGQQKTLLCALLLAQSDCITQKTGITPVVLLDDIGSELDTARYEKLLTFLFDSTIQLFITGTEKPLHCYAQNMTVFHLKNGKIIA